MELYIIRHGQPEPGNDTLTERGWDEARALVPRLIEINPTNVYTSPLIRAQQTAQPSLEALGMEFSVEDWMTESGIYHHLCRSEDSLDAGYTTSMKDGAALIKDFAPERTEALENMIASSDGFLARHGYMREGMRYKIVEPNDKRIVCFCHCGFGAAWVSHLLGCHPLFSWHQICFNPASVTKFDFLDLKNGYATPRAEYIGDVSHLWSFEKTENIIHR